MRSGAEIVRSRIRARLLQTLALIAVAGTLAILWGAASTPPVSPARADVRPAVQQMHEAPPAPEAAKPAEPLEIREAHSDGGYQYWLERQPAERRTGGN